MLKILRDMQVIECVKETLPRFRAFVPSSDFTVAASYSYMQQAVFLVKNQDGQSLAGAFLPLR